MEKLNEGEATAGATEAETDAEQVAGEVQDEGAEAGAGAAGTEGAEEDAGKEAAEADAHEGGEPEIKGLTPQAQEAVNRRIGKAVKRQKAAEERAQELEAELTKARGASDQTLFEMARAAGVHAEYASAEELKTLDRAEKLRAQRRWCLKYRDTGYEGSGGEDKSVTAEQIREWLPEIEDELLEAASDAKAIRRRAVEELRRDLEAGRKARRAPAAAAAPAAKPTLRKPPEIPGRSEGAARRAPVSGKSEKKGLSQETFAAAGADRQALERMYRETED